MTTICDLDPVIAQALSSAVGESTVVTSLEALRQHLEADPAEDTVVLGPTVDQSAAFRIAEQLRLWRPALGVILVRARVDTGLLAEAMRAGVRDVVGERNIAGLHEAVRRTQELAAAIRQQTPGTAAPGRPRGRIITVFSAKGGCGKTTLATNMAAALADKGRREVCLVDLDLAFGDVAIALQLFPAHTIADAVPLGEYVDFGAVQALLTPHSPGLRRPRAVRVRPLGHRGPHRHPGHPRAEEPEAHAGDHGPAQLPAGPLARRAQPRRLQGRARDQRGREEPARHDL